MKVVWAWLSVASAEWITYDGKNCYSGHGAVEIDSSAIKSVGVDGCKNKCDENAQCTGVTVGGNGDCFRRSNIAIQECASDAYYTTYVKQNPTPTPSPSPPPSPSPSGDSWTEYAGRTAYAGHGGTEIDSDSTAPTGYSAESCKDRCESDAACSCVAFRSTDGKCWKRGACVPSMFGTDTHFDTYVRSRPPPPTPPPGACDSNCGTGYEYCNPLGIQPDAVRSNNYFLAIGDWGAPLGDGMVSCQRTIAAKMKDYINARASEGKKLLFVVAVGDNFYWSGQDGSSWDSQWANVYGVNDPSSPFYQIPWLAVHGNHDMGSRDAGCACGKNRCHQFTENSPYPRLWWMPDYNWHYEIPEISLEVIALDTNGYHVGDLNGHGSSQPVYDYCGGKSVVENFLGGVASNAKQLLQCRAASGTSNTVMFFQHYPDQADDFIGTFQASLNRDAQFVHATGHTHAQSCRNKNGQCYDMLTGGGGGCGWDTYAGHPGGFSAVHLTEDGGYTSVIDTNDVNIGSCWADAEHASSQGMKLDQTAWNVFGNVSWGASFAFHTEI